MIGISTPQRLTWRGMDFSSFSTDSNNVLNLHCGRGWQHRAGLYQFEYWIGNIWKAFHPAEKFIPFIAAQQSTELNYIFDLADMLCQPTEEKQQETAYVER